MAKAKNPVEDEAQSKRFIDLATELEDAGELSLTEGERALDGLVKRARKSSQKPEDS